MNIEIYRITGDHIKPLLHQSPNEYTREEIDSLHKAADVSSYMLAGIYNSKLIGLLGFVPLTLLSDTAYMWLHNTKLTTSNRIAFGRVSRRVIANMLQIYPNIIGKCLDDSAMKYVQWLGAEFEPKQDHPRQFIIRRAA